MTIILCLFIAFFVGVPICFALGIVSIGSLIASGMPLIVYGPAYVYRRRQHRTHCYSPLYALW